jgi:hypothetical protein
MPRHALKLPAGSVRAILAFGILGMLWLLVLYYTNQQDKKLPLLFIYLQVLMVLILGHYFTAHGNSIGKHISTHSPLGLPTGTVRLLLIVAYGGLAYYLYVNHDTFEMPRKADFILLLGLLLGGYVLGNLLTHMIRWVNDDELPAWYVDIQAWAAILAVLGMGVLLVYRLLIDPSLPEDLKVGAVSIDAALAAIVGFYFGSRS